jgi:hypothetical protein
MLVQLSAHVPQKSKHHRGLSAETLARMAWRTPKWASSLRADRARSIRRNPLAAAGRRDHAHVHPDPMIENDYVHLPKETARLAE